MKEIKLSVAILMIASGAVFVLAGLTSIIWDVAMSSLQLFFLRIFDMNLDDTVLVADISMIVFGVVHIVLGSLFFIYKRQKALAIIIFVFASLSMVLSLYSIHVITTFNVAVMVLIVIYLSRLKEYRQTSHSTYQPQYQSYQPQMKYKSYSELYYAPISKQEKLNELDSMAAYGYVTESEYYQARDGIMAQSG